MDARTGPLALWATSRSFWLAAPLGLVAFMIVLAGIAIIFSPGVSPRKLRALDESLKSLEPVVGSGNVRVKVRLDREMPEEPDWLALSADLVSEAELSLHASSNQRPGVELEGQHGKILQAESMVLRISARNESLTILQDRLQSAVPDGLKDVAWADGQLTMTWEAEGGHLTTSAVPSWLSLVVAHWPARA